MNDRRLRRNENNIGEMIEVLLTDFLADERRVPRPPRDGGIGPKRSKKLILTGWPFAFRRGAIISLQGITGVA